MGRPKNTENRKAQIADAFIDVIADVGFAGATVPRIAKRAGLAQGLLHYHFADKDQMLQLAVDRLAVRMEARLDARLRHAKKDARARVHAYIDAWLGVGDDADVGAVRAWSAIGEEATRNAAVRAVYAPVLARSVARLKAEISALLPPKRSADLALRVVIAIEGAIRVGLGAPGLITPGSAARTVAAVVDGAVQGAE